MLTRKFLNTSALLVIMVLALPAAALAGPSDWQSSPAKAGNIEISDFTASVKGENVEIVMTLKNNGKTPETVVDAETTFDGTMDMITKGKDGKDTPGSIKLDLPAGKSASFAQDTQYLHVTGFKKAPAQGDNLRVILHFRSSPNAILKVPVTKASGGSFFGGGSKE